MAGGSRTEQGKIATKTGGTTLTLSNKTVPIGHCLEVGIGCENSQLAPDTVTHNGCKLRRKEQQNNSDGIHASVWIKGEYKNDQTGDIVATWAAPIGKRAMVATSYDLAQKKDDSASSQVMIATDNPAIGRTLDLITATALVADVRYEINSVGTTDFMLVGAPDNIVGTLFYTTGAGTGTGNCREAFDTDNNIITSFFVSKGPGTDHESATTRIYTGGAWTAANLGQQVGTTGGEAATNITIVETYLEVASGSHVQVQLQGATSRVWANVLLALEERIPWYRCGITPSDMIVVDTIVKAVGGDIEELYFGYNEDEGRWEAFEVIAGTLTLRTFRRTRTGTWITS